MNLQQLESRCRLMGGELKKMAGKDAGFVLFLMDFGVGGNLTYVSNIEREDMIVTIESWVSAMKQNLVDEQVAPGRKSKVDETASGFSTPEDRFRCALQDIQRLLGTPPPKNTANMDVLREIVCDKVHSIARLAVLGQDWERVPG